jgi:hypothetical protein
METVISFETERRTEIKVDVSGQPDLERVPQGKGTYGNDAKSLRPKRLTVRYSDGKATQLTLLAQQMRMGGEEGRLDHSIRWYGSGVGMFHSRPLPGWMRPYLSERTAFELAGMEYAP